MPTYLIETPHTEEECASGAEEWLRSELPRKAELFDKTYFGCEAGVHDAWTIADFENEDEAWKYVSQAERAKARVVPVNAYSFEEMVTAHQEG